MEFVEEPLSSSTHDIALVTTLEKAEDVAVYGSHPEHVKSGRYLCSPLCDGKYMFRL